MQKNVSINGEDVSKICEIVGIKVGQETQGYQTHYGRKIITVAVWAKPGLSLERFVMEQAKDFNSDLAISQVRPAKRREVTLLVTGLTFNTPDAQVKHYVESFGAKFVNAEPVYGVYHEGPWKGQYNGERRGGLHRADLSYGNLSPPQWFQDQGSLLRKHKDLWKVPPGPH